MLAIPAVVLEVHLVAVERVRDRVGRTAVWMTGGALLEVGLASAGALAGGIGELAVGYAAAVVVEAMLAVPTLREVARTGREARRW